LKHYYCLDRTRDRDRDRERKVIYNIIIYIFWI